MRLLFGFYFITSMVFAQSDDQAIQHIKQQYTIISELQEKGLLQEKEIAYSCKDLSIRATLTYYYQNEDLKFISHSYHQGHYAAFNDYYISNDSLFFYLNSDGFDNDETIYDENTGDVIGTEEDWSASELRIYFNKENAIKCLIKQFENEDVTDDIKEKYPDVSMYFKSEVKECDPVEIKEVLSIFRRLIAAQKQSPQELCKVHGY